MRKHLITWELAGFLWTVIAGTLLHFAYAWSGNHPVVAAFSSVNESVWEHMKLLLIPVFLFSVVQVCFPGKDYRNFLAARGLSAMAGVLLIPVLVYTYTGALGRDFLWADIAIFVAAAALTFALDSALLRRGALSSGWMQLLGLVLLWGMLFLFVWCTYRPPEFPLWRDPLTLGYGIP
jgi:hypothetical protein